MPRDELRELLEQLHTRLASTSALDEDSRKLLSTVSQDIEKALAGGEGGEEPPQPRLEALAVDFEVEHPALAEVLRRIIDTLGKAGI